MPGFARDDTQTVSSPYSYFNQASVVATPGPGGYTNVSQGAGFGGGVVAGPAIGYSQPSGGGGSYSPAVTIPSGSSSSFDTARTIGSGDNDTLIGSSASPTHMVDGLSGTAITLASSNKQTLLDSQKNINVWRESVGLKKIKEDGLWGPQTKRATKEFQEQWTKDHPEDPIKADGYIGIAPPGIAQTGERLRYAAEAALALRSSGGMAQKAAFVPMPAVAPQGILPALAKSVVTPTPPPQSAAAVPYGGSVPGGASPARYGSTVVPTPAPRPAPTPTAAVAPYGESVPGGAVPARYGEAAPATPESSLAVAQREADAAAAAARAGEAEIARAQYARSASAIDSPHAEPIRKILDSYKPPPIDVGQPSPDTRFWNDLSLDMSLDRPVAPAVGPNTKVDVARVRPVLAPDQPAPERNAVAKMADWLAKTGTPEADRIPLPDVGGYLRSASDFLRRGSVWGEVEPPAAATTPPAATRAIQPPETAPPAPSAGDIDAFTGDVRRALGGLLVVRDAAGNIIGGEQPAPAIGPQSDQARLAALNPNYPGGNVANPLEGAPVSKVYTEQAPTAPAIPAYQQWPATMPPPAPPAAPPVAEPPAPGIPPPAEGLRGEATTIPVGDGRMITVPPGLSDEGQKFFKNAAKELMSNLKGQSPQAQQMILPHLSALGEGLGDRVLAVPDGPQRVMAWKKEVSNLFAAGGLGDQEYTKYIKINDLAAINETANHLAPLNDIIDQLIGGGQTGGGAPGALDQAQQLAFDAAQGEGGGGPSGIRFWLGGQGHHGYPPMKDLGGVLNMQKHMILNYPPSQGYPQPVLHGGSVKTGALDQAQRVVASRNGIAPDETVFGQARGNDTLVGGGGEDPLAGPPQRSVYTGEEIQNPNWESSIDWMPGSSYFKNLWNNVIPTPQRIPRAFYAITGGPPPPRR